MTSHEPGEAFITASYDTFTVGSSFIVLATDTPFEYYDPATGDAIEVNFIDELVARKLTMLRMNPSPLCTDEEFIRRAYLDVIGLLPTRQDRSDFLADGAPRKRERLVNMLRPTTTSRRVLSEAY